MPLRYGIPIMAVFATEHWLLSESPFIIRLLLSEWNGARVPGGTISGFSVIPSLFSESHLSISNITTPISAPISH